MDVKPFVNENDFSSEFTIEEAAYRIIELNPRFHKPDSPAIAKIIKRIKADIANGKLTVHNGSMKREEIHRWLNANSLSSEYEFIKSPVLTPKIVASTEDSFGKRERDSLLKLVIGMAVVGYKYDPTASKSTVPKEIANDLMSAGMSMDDGTVLKYLKEAATTVLPGKPRQS